MIPKLVQAAKRAAMLAGVGSAVIHAVMSVRAAVELLDAAKPAPARASDDVSLTDEITTNEAFAAGWREGRADTLAAIAAEQEQEGTER